MLEDGVVFSRDVKDYLLRDLIKRVIFTDAPFPEGYKLVDLSLDQDRSILGWNQTINDELCLVISTGEKGKGIELNRACNMMFVGFFDLESIEWNNIVSSREVRSMRDMFDGCQSIKSIDLSCFDVSNVRYMSRMFSACENLEDIIWFRFATSKVEDVSHMFTNCPSLKFINLSGFDTSSLKSCRKMFNKCGVKAVNLGNWYPTSPEQELNTEGMFNTTGLLSVLTTSNPQVQKEYFNLDDATRECQEKNNIPREIVSVSEWKVPTYSWEKDTPKSKRTDYQVEK
jgi:surface protein